MERRIVSLVGQTSREATHLIILRMSIHEHHGSNAPCPALKGLIDRKKVTSRAEPEAYLIPMFTLPFCDDPAKVQTPERHRCPNFAKPA